MSDVATELPPEGEPQDGLVVFMLLWGGGTLADADDLAGLYRELSPGAVIVRLCCGSKGSFGLQCNAAYGIRAASQAWAQAPGSKRLVVHLFSNAGFHTWTEVLKAWDSLSRKDSHPSLAGPLPPMSEVLRGVILDSAPDAQVAQAETVRSFVQGMAVFLAQVAASVHDGSEASIKAASIQARKATLITLGAQSPVLARLMAKPEETLVRVAVAEPRIVHQLEPPVGMQFIYSKDDTIIKYVGVQQYIEEVKQRPNRRSLEPPKELVFERSKHVFHKRDHKEEYWNFIKPFLSSVLDIK